MLIDIDDQVYSELQRRAKAYVERTPNDTLRRLFKLPPEAKPGETAPNSASVQSIGGRQQKVRLSDLIERGLLKLGQNLDCVDYAGNVIPKSQAQVAPGNKLMPLHHDARPHSMSELAVIMLRKAGHNVGAARGPAHWRTADGRRVLDLWHQR